MDELVVDLDALTLGDLEAGEEIAGADFGAALDGRGMSMKAMVALVYIARRKGDPELTLEDVRSMSLVSVGNIQVVGGKRKAANPTSGDELESVRTG